MIAVVAAILLPGGFLALFGALLFGALRKTERGQKALEAARRTVPSWAQPALRRTMRLAA